MSNDTFEISFEDGVFLDDVLEDKEVKPQEPRKPRKARPHEIKMYHRAYAIEDIPEIDTVKCLVTKSKFIGTQWWHLKKGQTITAPKRIIMALKDAGFVE